MTVLLFRDHCVSGAWCERISKPRASSPVCLIAEGCLGLCLLPGVLCIIKRIQKEKEVGLLEAVCAWEELAGVCGRLFVPDTEQAPFSRKLTSADAAAFHRVAPL